MDCDFTPICSRYRCRLQEYKIWLNHKSPRLFNTLWYKKWNCLFWLLCQDFYSGSRMFHMSSDHFMSWWLPDWTKYSSLHLNTLDRISRAYHKKVMKVGCHMLWPSPEIPMQRYHFQSIFSFSSTVLSFSSALMSLLSPCGAYMSHEGNKPGPSVLCKKPIGSSSDCQQYRNFKRKRGSARILNVQNRLHVHSWAWSICDLLEESVSCQHMSTYQNRLASSTQLL